MDTYAHATFNYLVQQTGSISFLASYTGPMGKEVGNPLVHIASAIAGEVTGLDIRLATICVVSIPLILLSITVFIVTRRILHVKYALSSMLIFTICTPVIYWTAVGQTTSYAFALFLAGAIVYFCRFHYMKGIHISDIILLIILAVAIILAHTFSTAIIFTILCLLYVISILNTHHILTPECIILFVYGLIVFIITSVLSWSASGVSSAFQLITNSFENSVSLKKGGITWQDAINVPSQTYSDTALSESFFIILACTLILFVYIILKQWQQNKPLGFDMMQMSILFGGIFATYFIAMLIISSMSYRLMPYCSFFFAISVAFILLYAGKTYVRDKAHRILGAAIAIGIVAFICLGQPIINMDSTIWGKSIVNQQAFTASECSGTEKIVSIIPRDANIAEDWDCHYHLGYYQLLYGYSQHGIQTEPYSDYFGQSVFLWNEPTSITNKYDYVIFRERLLTHVTMQVGQYADGSTYRQRIQLTPDDKAQLLQNVHTTFDNGELSLLIS